MSQQRLEPGEVGRLGRLSGQPLCEGLQDSLGYPLVLRAGDIAVLPGYAKAAQLGVQGAAAAPSPDWPAVKTMLLSVRAGAGTPCCVQAARNAAATIGLVTRSCGRAQRSAAAPVNQDHDFGAAACEAGTA